VEGVRVSVAERGARGKGEVGREAEGRGRAVISWISGYGGCESERVTGRRRDDATRRLWRERGMEQRRLAEVLRD
jgi:hypothetical protein